MSWVLKHSECRLGERLVLLVLADHAKEDGSSSWPSIATISHEARMSQSQVKRCLRKLESSESIVETGVSKQGTHIYQVMMRGGAQYDPRGGANATVGGGANPPEGGRRMSPEPSLKQPSFEKQPSKDIERVRAGEVEIVKPTAWKVDRKIVAREEEELSQRVLELWNEISGQKLRGRGWLGKIVMRIREHPELTYEDHGFVIQRNLDDPWWKGDATPSVIYGSDTQFDRSIVQAGSANRNGSQGAFEIALAELRRIEAAKT